MVREVIERFLAKRLMEQAMAMDHNDPEYRMTEAEVKVFMVSNPWATVNDFYESFTRKHADELVSFICLPLSTL